MTTIQPSSSTSPDSWESSQVNPAQIPARRSLPTFAQNLLRSHLVETITVSIAASLILFGASTWNVWTIYRSFRTSVTNQFQIESLSGKIVHLDEVLTMSARMAASTGDLKWEKRYRQFEPDLDQAIKQTTQLAPQVVKAQSAQTDTANLKLVEFENRAFALVREGKRQEAFNLLLSQDYDAQKQIYAQGIENIVTNLKTETKTQLQSQSQRLLWAIVFACVSFPILLLGWLIVLSLVRTYIRERQLAQDALLESQNSLLKLNEQLETKAVQVLEQEQATKESRKNKLNISLKVDL